MDPHGEPSRTAMLAATGRAVHLFHHGPRAILQDWLAFPFLGPHGDDLIALGKALLGDIADPFATWFAARSRLSEDWLSAANYRQHVVLGAGLDSSAWRTASDLRVLEVDHPATQEWKRSRIAALDLPEAAEWVPVDFERDSLADALEAARLDDDGVFVSWHAVVPYLTEDAIRTTLAALPRCTLAVSYVPPEAHWGESSDIGSTIQSIAADSGEPWLTLLSPEEFAALLAEAGFAVAEDVGDQDIRPRYGAEALNFERMVLARRDN